MNRLLFLVLAVPLLSGLVGSGNVQAQKGNPADGLACNNGSASACARFYGGVDLTAGSAAYNMTNAPQNNTTPTPTPTPPHTNTSKAVVGCDIAPKDPACVPTSVLNQINNNIASVHGQPVAHTLAHNITSNITSQAHNVTSHHTSTTSSHHSSHHDSTDKSSSSSKDSSDPTSSSSKDSSDSTSTSSHKEVIQIKTQVNHKP